MKKPKFYYCDVWKQNYWYCLGWSEKFFVKYIKKEFNYEPDIRYCDGKLIEFTSDEGSIIVIWTRDKKNMGSLVHECVHAANYTLKKRGWKPDFENDEPHTYLVETIFNKAIK